MTRLGHWKEAMRALRSSLATMDVSMMRYYYLDFYFELMEPLF